MPTINLPKVIHASSPEILYELVSGTNEQMLSGVSDSEKIAVFEPFYSLELDTYISLATTEGAKEDTAKLYSYMRIRNHLISQLDLKAKDQQSVHFI